VKVVLKLNMTTVKDVLPSTLSDLIYYYSRIRGSSKSGSESELGPYCLDPNADPHEKICTYRGY
jgi:hypothetical protein